MAVITCPYCKTDIVLLPGPGLDHVVDERWFDVCCNTCLGVFEIEICDDGIKTHERGTYERRVKDGSKEFT